MVIGIAISVILGLLVIIIYMMTDEKTISVDFEVHGFVQGVFFRDNTRRTATKNGCVGWVKNTFKGTVVGQIQGPKKNIDYMKHWLSKVGSHESRIDRCDFSNEKTVSEMSYKNFSIR